MRNVFVIAHASDIDGVGSAALAKIRYGMPARNLLFTDYSKEGASYVYNELKHRDIEGALLVLADLGTDKNNRKGFLRIVNMVKGRNGTVYWFDHHPWPEKSIKEIASRCDIAVVGENPLYCGTEITRIELGIESAFTKRFAGIVHHSDFNLRPRTKAMERIIGAYALSITLYNISDSRQSIQKNLRHVAEVISGGRLLDKKIISDAKKFELLNESRIRAMVNGLYTGKYVAVGFSNDIQSTAGCAAIHENTDRDIAIYVNVRNGRGHIRSKRLDISGLAVALGGGGHPHASGFSFRLQDFNNLRTSNDRKRFLEYVDRKAAALFG